MCELVQRGGGMIQRGRGRLGRPVDAARGLACFRAEEHRQPRDGALIVLAPSAQVADPGWEIRHGDKFLAEPGEIGDVAQMHNACRTFTARNTVYIGVEGSGVGFVHRYIFIARQKPRRCD